MTSENLIDDRGRPRLGYFPDGMRVDQGACRHRRPDGRAAGPLARWLGYKQFQYFGILSDTLLAGCALVHLRHTAMAFVYVHDSQRGMLLDKTLRLPLGWGCQLAESPVRGASRCGFGRLRIDMGYEPAPRRKTLRVDWPGRLRIEALCDETAAAFAPMSLCTRIGRNGWVYAHKVAAVPARGHIEVAGQRYDLGRLDAFGHHDFSAGYMRRETFWNWACFSGRCSAGMPVGLNVSCGVNETSYSENCWWRDGELEPLGLCQFDYDWDAPATRPWHVTNADGRLDLTFTPAGAHQERLNLGLIASDFKQVFGRFTGSIRDGEGRVSEIRDMPGFVEDQYAKW